MPRLPLLAIRAGTIALAWLAVVVSPGPADASILQRLDYETGNFSQWIQVQALPGRASIVTWPVRQGKYAARFEVRPGDHPIDTYGERSEAFDVTGEQAGKESWWRWATRFPRGFKASPGDWNVFTQWHNTGTACPPPVAFEVNRKLTPTRLRLRVWGGPLNLTTCQAKYMRVWNFAVLERRKWYNFVFHVKWSPYASKGLVELWVNGRKAVPRTSTATLYPNEGVYVKQGYYRLPVSWTTSIYHDGLRRLSGRPAGLP